MTSDAATIRCLCLDVDGVLTDGRLYVDEDGRVTRAFHIQDGLGIKLFRDVLGEVVVISGKASRATEHRLKALGVQHYRLGSADKLTDLQEILGPLGLTLAETAVMGDDWPDAPLMRACAYPLAPADAANEVRQIARYVTRRNGGCGAVREAVEHLLREAGRWEQALGSAVAHDATRA